MPPRTELPTDMGAQMRLLLGECRTVAEVDDLLATRERITGEATRPEWRADAQRRRAVIRAGRG